MILQRHRAARWLAPVGVVGIAVLVAAGIFTDDPQSEALPDTSPTSLMAALQTSHVSAFSGTVVSTLSLGLPKLPVIGSAGERSTLASLLSGSHTLQVWFDGAQRQRVALLGPTDETDVFRNGRSVWQWTSADHNAVHLTLPASPGAGTPLVLPSGDSRSLTPPSLARTALAGLDPTTTVRVKHGRSVADRSTYELILTPRTDDTRVGSVHIAVDGATKVPLAVQVYARGHTEASMDVAFTSIRFTPPPKRNFSFTPPPDAKVHTMGVRQHSDGPAVSGGKPGSASESRLQVLGSGWTRIVATHLPKAATKSVRHSSALRSLRPVAGPWGKGRLLESALLSVLVTDDGRVYAGSVMPSALFARAATR